MVPCWPLSTATRPKHGRETFERRDVDATEPLTSSTPSTTALRCACARTQAPQNPHPCDCIQPQNPSRRSSTPHNVHHRPHLAPQAPPSGTAHRPPQHRHRPRIHTHPPDPRSLAVRPPVPCRRRRPRPRAHHGPRPARRPADPIRGRLSPAGGRHRDAGRGQEEAGGERQEGQGPCGEWCCGEDNCTLCHAWCPSPCKRRRS
jgi:hypothetical protein